MKNAVFDWTVKNVSVFLVYTMDFFRNSKSGRCWFCIEILYKMYIIDVQKYFEYFYW